MGYWPEASLESGLAGKHPLLAPSGQPCTSQPGSPLPSICLCLSAHVHTHTHIHTHTHTHTHSQVWACTHGTGLGGCKWWGGGCRRRETCSIPSSSQPRVIFSLALPLINGSCVAPSPSCIPGDQISLSESWPRALGRRELGLPEWLGEGPLPAWRAVLVGVESSCPSAPVPAGPAR